MRRISTDTSRWLGVALLAALGVPSTAVAQSILSEGFDNLGPFVTGQLGPASLSQQGWIFRNQSNPGPTSQPTTWTWREGPYQLAGCGWNTYAPASGAGYLGADAKSASWNGGQVNDWAILPALTGVGPGTTISFFARQVLPEAITSLEVRYSPSGGISTGSGVNGIGDFTTVLLSIVPPTTWTFFSAPVPGNGRLAFRYSTSMSTSSCLQALGIDQLEVGTGPGPCPNYPPIPVAGQTVHWTQSGSPYSICSTTVIPPTARVIVDPGVTVRMESGFDLDVQGSLEAGPGAKIRTAALATMRVTGEASFVGIPGQPVVLFGGPQSHASGVPPRIVAVGDGRITVAEADLTTTVTAEGTGVVIASDVAASGAFNGFYSEATWLDNFGGTLAVRDSTFTEDAEIFVSSGYVLIDGCNFDGGRVEARRARAGQTLLLDGLVARNRPSDSVFTLTGGDFFFGPSNVIDSNAFPVILEGGGIASGSSLPATGNTSNLVYATMGTAEGRVTWANVGLPYRVDGNNNVGGRLTVKPGVVVKMGPAAFINVFNSGAFELLGLPTSPIRFERLNPSQPWGGVDLSNNTLVRHRVEHTEFRGGTEALRSQFDVLRVESCLFENNSTALRTTNFAFPLVRGSRFFANQVGVFTSGPMDFDADGYPNWFDGNGVAINATAGGSAMDNYWGHPSGPSHASNPSGQGDSVQGSIPVTPFATAPPPPNSAPVVRLMEHSRLMEEGTRVIVHWTASDDDAIQEFRIYHSPHGENPGLSLLASSIPGTARSWDITVPAAPAASNYPDLSALRVEAVDGLGQTGYDEMLFRTPNLGSFNGGFQPDNIGGVQRPGESYQVCGQYLGSTTSGGFSAEMWLDGDRQYYDLGGTNTTCLPLVRQMPPISTDLARIVTVHTAGAGGLYVYGFTDYFEIRPDASIGDAPPTVTLRSPNAKKSPVYSGGTIVPIVWSANDDEGLRSFDIHGSYDGGRTWHTIVADLAGTTRKHDWRLPPISSDMAVRVRVIARDHRFQNSSSTSGRFKVTP